MGVELQAGGDEVVEEYRKRPRGRGDMKKVRTHRLAGPAEEGVPVVAGR